MDASIGTIHLSGSRTGHGRQDLLHFGIAEAFTGSFCDAESGEPLNVDGPAQKTRHVERGLTVGKGDPHMLVLSRRADEKIIFPGLGISLKVLRVKGNVVKLGVDAPSDVKILRDEVSIDDATIDSTIVSREARHEFRNRLNAVNIGLHLINRLIIADRIEEAQFRVRDLVAELQALDTVVSTPQLTHGNTQRSALLVEDDHNERELLAAYLRLSGFHVDTVPDGSDALGRLNEFPLPDLVLLDMQMPRFNGAETIQVIRRDPELKDLTVFAISGTQPSEMGVTTGSDGVNRWFPKPLNPEMLVREIKAEFAPAQGAA